jgi:hypothetical protein
MRAKLNETEIDDELLEIRQAVGYERAKISTSSYKTLWMDKSVRSRLWIAFVISGGPQLIGQGRVREPQLILQPDLQRYLQGRINN